MRKVFHRKLVDKIINFIDDEQIIAIHGMRQVGKTTLLHYLKDNYLIKKTSPRNIFYFDLEDFVFFELCQQGPKEVIIYLKNKGADFTRKIYLLIDEIQYLENPSNFLKLFYDHYKEKVKLIVSGSSSFLIKKKFKDSLVGRTIDFELFPLDFEEFLWFKNLKYNLKDDLASTVNKELFKLYNEYVIYGGYPAIVLEDDIEKKEIKLKQIINTYLKKDLKDLTQIRHLNKFNNLLKILAHQSAKLLNIGELSNTVGISRKTVEEYLFIMESTYIIKLIYPFHKNIRSELTKMPKIFFEDTGIMNLLINRTFSQNIEGSLLETSIYSLLRKNIEVENIYFWRTNTYQEIDFVIEFPKKKEIVPVEVKTFYFNKHTSSLRYFQQKYKPKRIYLCCLQEKEPPKYKEISIIYPWQIYRILK
jgi:hypothetical protein